MAKQDFDFTKATQDLLGAFKIDTTVFDDAVKGAAEFNSKLAKIALTSAKKNVDLTTAWTAETLKKVEAANKVQKEAGDYVTVASDLTSAQVQALPEKISNYVEVAKAAQMEAVELFTAAGKDLQAEAVSKVKEATAKAA